jgi:alpha/beta superfamily hydrolase
MTEQPISFNAGRLQLEGLLYLAPGAQGVVITHPHSLYGGSLYNNVVEALVRAYQQHGYTTLRFNFRGVGNSQGRYDDGEGEQQDVKAALAYLAGKGKTRLELTGYSFGAWVNALARPAQDPVRQMIMVAPPVNFLDFHPIPSLPKLTLVITGDRDVFAPPTGIVRLLPGWNPAARLEVIPGADHFYGNHTRALETVLNAYLAKAGDPSSGTGSSDGIGVGNRE